MIVLLMLLLPSIRVAFKFDTHSLYTKTPVIANHIALDQTYHNMKYTS